MNLINIYNYLEPEKNPKDIMKMLLYLALPFYVRPYMSVLVAITISMSLFCNKMKYLDGDLSQQLHIHAKRIYEP